MSYFRDSEIDGYRYKTRVYKVIQRSGDHYYQVSEKCFKGDDVIAESCWPAEFFDDITQSDLDRALTRKSKA